MVNSGYRQSLYFGNESLYGSAAVIDESIGLVQSVNPTETNNFIKVRTLGGTRDYNNIVPGKFEVSGSFEYYLQNGVFLRDAFGEDSGSTSTTDSGPRIHTGASYLHVMGSASSPGANCFPSFTLEFADEEPDCDGSNLGTNNLYRLFTGCRVGNLAISGTVDDPVKIAVDWQAQGVTVSTADATSVAESTKDPYVFYQGAVYATSGAVTAYTDIDTTSMIAEVNTFNVGLNNNLEAIWYISGTTNAYQTKRTLKSLNVKGRDFTSSLGLHFSTKSMYEKFLGAAGATGPQDDIAKYQVVLDFIRSGSISGVKLATDDWFRLVLEDSVFDNMNITGSPEDIIAQNIDVMPEKAILYIVDDDASYA